MFSMTHDPLMTDESLMLSDMYAKQNLNMPMPSPAFDENGMMLHDMSEFHTPREHMDMPLTPFGTIDPMLYKPVCIIEKTAPQIYTT